MAIEDVVWERLPSLPDHLVTRSVNAGDLLRMNVQNDADRTPASIQLPDSPDISDGSQEQSKPRMLPPTLDPIPGGPRAQPPSGRWRKAPRTAPTVGRPGKLRLKPSFGGFRDFHPPEALQNKPFRRYWISQFVSLAGTWMQNTGAQLVVLSLTSSAVLVGAINVVSALPLLLFSLFGGVLADRVDRRKILMTTQSALGVLSLVYAYLIFTNRIEYWHILVIAGVAGTVASFELPASQAFVSELVRRQDLPQALALNSASFNATRTIGPAFAGIVIGALGTAAAFVINAATLLAPISVLFSLRKIIKPPVKSTNKTSGLSQLKAGVSYIRKTDELLGLILITTVFSFFVFPNLLVLMPLYLTDGLGGSDNWVAIGISALGIGSLVGAIVLIRGSRLEAAAGKRMRASMAILTIGLVWLALSPSPWIAVIGVVISGYAFATGNTQIQTRVQQLAPDELRGRVLSVNSLAFNGVMPFSTMAVAGASQVVGQHVVMAVCAGLLAVSTFLIWKRFAWKAFVPASGTIARVPEVVPAGH